MTRYYVVRWDVFDGENQYFRLVVALQKDTGRPCSDLILRHVLEWYVPEEELDDAVASCEKAGYLEIEGGLRALTNLRWEEIDETTYETLARYV